MLDALSEWAHDAPVTRTLPPASWVRVAASGLWPSSALVDGDPPREAEVELCARWLAVRGRKTERIRRDRTNRQLCRLVDAYLRSSLGYTLGVNEGALIEAARRAGYQIERAGPGSPNAYLNLAAQTRDDVDPPPPHSFRAFLRRNRGYDPAVRVALADERMPHDFGSLDELLAHFGRASVDEMWEAPGGRSLLLAWDDHAATCRRRGEDVAGLPPVVRST